MKTTTLEQIRSFHPCYDPAEIGMKEGREYKITPQTIMAWSKRVHDKADIIWLLCRNEFMSEKDMRLFAVWCAREALRLSENPDKRSIEACNVAERFANGEATRNELDAAWAAAGAAAWAAAGAAARAAAREAQIKQLLKYFK
jgi:hypothetical protein